MGKVGSQQYFVAAGCFVIIMMEHVSFTDNDTARLLGGQTTVINFLASVTRLKPHPH